MPSNKRPSDITFWGTLQEMLLDFYHTVRRFRLPPMWHYKLTQYALLMRIERPIGTLLLLWPTLWALWLAAEGSFPDLKLLVIFSVGVFLTRSAGCVINDFADRNLDGKVERTKKRPLANRLIAEREALLLFVVLGLLAFGLVLLLNTLSIILSVIAIAIATAYPFMKRITYFPQVVLGAAFSMSIPMAFAATHNTIPDSAWLLYIANLLWVLAYDTLYGMVDKQDDLKVGIKSTAILFGEADLQIIAIIQGFFLFGMVMVGFRFELGFWYFLGLTVALGLVIWQLHSCKKREREKCFAAFLNNNWVGVSIFCGILLAKFQS